MVSVLGIHFQDRGKISGHIEQCALTFPVILNGGDIWRAYDVVRFPTFLVVGPDGRIIFNHPGRLNDEDRDALEQAALEARAGIVP